MFEKEDINDISSELINLIFHLSARIFNPNQMSKELCIPHSHMKAMFHIVVSGPCPVSKIADDLTISRSNMTPIIDNLIAEGYVNRYNAPNDRRVIMIEATEKAHAFIEHGKVKLAALLAEKIAVLDDQDKEALKTLIPQLNSIITKMKITKL